MSQNYLKFQLHVPQFELFGKCSSVSSIQAFCNSARSGGTSYYGYKCIYAVCPPGTSPLMIRFPPFMHAYGEHAQRGTCLTKLSGAFLK